MSKIFNSIRPLEFPRSPQTQLGRRLKFVDVSFVFANTPEAKGKIERVHQVWQDRLPAYAAREGFTESTPLEEINEHRRSSR